MNLDFPANPNPGDTFTASNGIIYTYDGDKWVSEQGSLANVSSSIIPSANATYTLGNLTNQWSSAYIASNTLYLGSVPLTTANNQLVVAGNTVITTSTADSQISNGASNVTIPVLDGNVAINADTAAWVFGTDGNLNLPGGSKLSPSSSVNIDLIAGNGGWAELQSYQGNSYVWVDDGGAYIGTNWNAGPQSWTFEPSGQLSAPGNIVTTGNIVGGNIKSDNYFFANGVPFTSASLGNLTVTDQTITGSDINGNIDLVPDGSGVVNVPALSFNNGELIEPVDAAGGDLAYLGITTTGATDIRIGPGSGNIYTANLYASQNNVTSLGNANSRYNNLWLGSGNINFIDQALNTSQQMYALNGNMVIAGGTGLTVGNWIFNGNSMYIANASANITIGTYGATGEINFNRPITVINPADAGIAFQVDQTGTTRILTPANITPTAAALEIIATSTGNARARNFTGTLIQATGQDNTPARLSADAFGVDGTGQNAYVAWAGRAARGTVDVPSQTLANDTLFRFTAQGWMSNNAYAASIIRMNMLAKSDFAPGNTGTGFNFQATPIGSGTIQSVANLDTTGLTLLNNANIKFFDNTVQSTAFDPANVVTKVTVSTGLSQIGNQGNITITATGVQNVFSASTNQIIINDSGSKNLTLSLPQDINTNSFVQFGNMTITGTLTVANLVSTGNSTVDAITLNLGNNSTSNSQINQGGIILGNLAGSYNRHILYDLTGDKWNTGVAGLTTANLFTNNANVTTIHANATITAGAANSPVDYPDATIQAYSDLDSYTQVIAQNLSAGANASTDFVATNNIGDDTQGYIDMGINSNLYANVDFAVTGPNDGYLYVDGGNLVLGTATAAKTIKFFTGGTNSTSFLRGSLTNAGLSMVGNVTANNVIGNTITGTTVSSVGNVIAGNVVSLGQVIVTANITGGNLTSNATISAASNIRGANFLTTGLISAQGNITTAANIVTPNTVINSGVSTTGNVTGGNILVSGAGQISTAGNITGANLNATVAYVGTLLSLAGNITGGNLITSGLLSTTGNVVAGNLTTVGLGQFLGNVDAGNLRTAGLITATGNLNTQSGVSAQGNITGGNLLVSGNVSAAFASTTLTTAAQPNITSVGILSSLSVTGIIASSANISTTGNILAPNIIATTGFYDTLLSVSGNITGGNLIIGSNGNITTPTGSNGNININADGTGTLNISSVTPTIFANARTATNTSTGAIVVTGGAGIGGNIYAGGLISATGNIAGNFILGNGSQLTGLPATYSNTNVTSLLASFGSNTILTTGNITGGNLLFGSGIVSGTGNITGGNILFGAGIVSGTGNITGNYFLGNGSQLTGIVSSYGNSNVTTLLAGFGSNTILTTGNITGGNLLFGTGVVSGTGNITGGNVLFGAGVVSGTGNITGGNVLFGAGTVSGTGNIRAGNIITSSGTLLNSGLSTTGNVTAGNVLFGTGIVSGTGNITGGNLLSGAGIISTSGNITGGNVLGGTLVNATSLTGTTVSVSANVTAGNVLGGANVNATLHSGTTVSVSGNITGGNVLFGAGIVSGTGNITGGNLLAGTGQIITSGNITGGNILVGTGIISTSGNITGGNVLGGANVNATLHSGTTVSVSGNITGGNVLFGAGIVSGTGNVIGGNLNAAGLSLSSNVVSNLNVTANIAGGNITTPGIVSAVGNITGSFLLGNARVVTGLTPTVETYDSGSGATWTKPTNCNWVLIEMWGGGGSGGNGATNAPGGGGGGGAYNAITVPFSYLQGAVTYTVGAGGAAQASASTAGNAGNTTSVTLASFQGGGSVTLSAYGGGGGAINNAGGGGGGGGGITSVGLTTSGAGSTAGGAGGGLVGGTGGAAGAVGVDSVYGGGGGAGNGVSSKGGDSYWGGGGGGGGQDGAGTGANSGGNSTYGGGGGGGGVDSATGGTGGTSVFGGSGSAGTTGGTASSAGTLPAGGSGGTEAGGSGAGGGGRVRFTWWV